MSYVDPAGPADRDGLDPTAARTPDGAPEGIERFWAQFRRMRDPLGREELLIAYRHVVDEVLADVPAEELDESELAGLERRAVRGLAESIERFPDDAEIDRFAEFAGSRVRTAVTDGLERLDWLPRTILRRDPHRPGWPVGRGPLSPGARATPDQSALSFAAGRATAAARATSRVDEERAPFRALARTLGLGHADVVGAGEMDPADVVRAAMRRLPEQQRTVLTLQYLVGLSLEQIGAMLGTSLIGARRASEHALSGLRRSIEEDRGPLAAQAG